MNAHVVLPRRYSAILAGQAATISSAPTNFDLIQAKRREAPSFSYLPKYEAALNTEKHTKTHTFSKRVHAFFLIGFALLLVSGAISFVSVILENKPFSIVAAMVLAISFVFLYLWAETASGEYSKLD